ncbi:MAG: nucleotide exchange factor GrpE [Candidatus Aminicenantes bacterium]|nr:nucleotide exchange factor GrpE [Candidatus Aminicenantes bacterium]
MEMDKDKNAIGYVPDESDPEGEKEHAAGKRSHEDSGHRRKSVGRRAQARATDHEEVLKRVAAERDEFKDKYLRGLAEMDNFRKRIKREKDEFHKYVLSEFLLDLLQVYDNLERALKVKGPENEKAIVSGVEMIRKQFLELLRKYHVHEIDALGKHFDPAFHEALSKEERDGISKPVVVEVFQKGFVYNDKLLRPVLTKVAIPATKAAAEGEPGS